MLPLPVGEGWGEGMLLNKPSLQLSPIGRVCWQIDSDLSRVHIIDKNKNFCKSKQGRYEICPYKPSFAKISGCLNIGFRQPWI
ncbi:hypothetical protein [Alysiella filiformis]|uniref:hypothetical protein n=1 Tax=Alysiella filiformis TaxID=194196 RepID=UPI001178727E|nr:hypothetical protein [Alysiella filiformis]